MPNTTLADIYKRRLLGGHLSEAPGPITDDEPNVPPTPLPSAGPAPLRAPPPPPDRPSQTPASLPPQVADFVSNLSPGNDAPPENTGEQGSMSTVKDEEDQNNRGGGPVPDPSPLLAKDQPAKEGSNFGLDFLRRLNGPNTFAGIEQVIPLGRKGVIKLNGRPVIPEDRGEITPAQLLNIQTQNRRHADTLDEAKTRRGDTEAYRGKTLEQGEKRLKLGETRFAAAEGNKTEAEDHGIGTDFAKRPDVQAARKANNQLEDVKVAMQHPDPTTQQAVKNFLPRMMGEVGNLSAADRAVATRRMGWLNQLEDWYHEGAHGEYPEDKRQQIMQLADYMKEAQNNTLKAAAHEHALTYSKIYKDRKPEDIEKMLVPESGEKPATSFKEGQQVRDPKTGKVLTVKKINADGSIDAE